VRHDKRHASRVFNDLTADASVFGATEPGGCRTAAIASRYQRSRLTREVSGWRLDHWKCEGFALKR
jgi:hypothetical protein